MTDRDGRRTNDDSQARFLRLFLPSERELFRYVVALVPDVGDAEELLRVGGKDAGGATAERARAAAVGAGGAAHHDHQHVLGQVVAVGRGHAGAGQPPVQERPVHVEQLPPVALGWGRGQPTEPGERRFHRTQQRC